MSSIPGLGILIDDRFKRHVTDPGHPERAERLDAVLAGIEDAGGLASFRRIEAQPASDPALLRLHTADYLRRFDSCCRQAWPYMDVPDCSICPDSMEIARLAAGGVMAAARLVASGEIRRAFCAVRPPGHHAERDRAVGFCYFNNIALAATVLHDEFHIQRVLILDWDVHHGNGTQHLFEHEPGVFYISIHGHPNFLFPGTGFEHETGEGAGRGYTLNIPLEPNADDHVWREAFTERITPAVERYAPQMILLSTGFDAHTDDPLGNLDISQETFAWSLERVLELAGHLSGGRVVSVLEGGYNLGVLRRCIADHVRLLADGC